MAGIIILGLLSYIAVLSRKIKNIEQSRADLRKELFNTKERIHYILKSKKY